MIYFNIYFSCALPLINGAVDVRTKQYSNCVVVVAAAAADHCRRSPRALIASLCVIDKISQLRRVPDQQMSTSALQEMCDQMQ